MITLFIITLFLTFLIIRLFAYTLHDMKNYGTKKEKSKTLTGYLRNKTGYNLHHFHIGIIILIVSVPLTLIFGLTKYLVIALAMSISMIIEQAIPIIDNKINYFHLKSMTISFILHILISLLVILIIKR